ncbi:MAG TPA: peptide chain release factor 2 [Candidatus Limnocylindrales bacterium]
MSRAATRWTPRPSATWPSGSGRHRGIFDLATKERRVAELEALTSEPGFWDDQRAAQKVLREADGLRSESALWRDLLARADDLLTTLELVEESGDAELTAELERGAAKLESDFARERTQLLFGGEYDDRGAMLSISAGAGGTEATDWAEMLLRMYLRWAERHRFHTDVVDQQEGEQAGIKSATVEVNGRAAYGWLRAERGVHRLVRISPYDSQKRRQTTFALVEVLPEVEDDIETELDWDVIRVDTFRSQGAGGQHVNKTDSAVRLTHLPTGIVAQSQNERSQTQNKEMAIKVLKARLLERALEERELEVRKLKGEHVEAGWGNQIRSYVLHPYQMVKDLRTGEETGNTQAVLDGDLDDFMRAELERVATGASVAAIGGDPDDGSE